MCNKEEKKVIEMTAEELNEFELFKSEQEIKKALQKKKDDKEAYESLVEDCIKTSAEQLLDASVKIVAVKAEVLNRFQKAIEMKAEIFGTEKMPKYSNTFTDKESMYRISVGQYTTDAYRDTVNEGIAIVREEISSFANNEDTETLVDIVMQLLSKDKSGNIKASRLLQLESTAAKLGNERIMEGVQIIKESYQPQTSKTYIRLERKMENGRWETVPLGFTEA